MIVVRASVVQQPVSGARVAPTNDAGWPPPNRHDLQCSGHNAGVAAGRGRVPAEDLIEFVRIAWCGQTGLSVCGVRCAVCGVRCAVCGVRCLFYDPKASGDCGRSSRELGESEKGNQPWRGRRAGDCA